MPPQAASRRSPAQRVRREKEKQGSGPGFRRQAETKGSGLCFDAMAVLKLDEK